MSASKTFSKNQNEWTDNCAKVMMFYAIATNCDRLGVSKQKDHKYIESLTINFGASISRFWWPVLVHGRKLQDCCIIT